VIPHPSASGPRNKDAYRFPVSVKGVIIRDGRVILLKNERAEWELPGGKLEPDETPTSCVAREVAEELKLSVESARLLDSWIYTIAPGVRVLILTYGCTEARENPVVLGDEHDRFAWFPIEDVESLEMPAGYKASIRQWASEATAQPADGRDS
jgi:8-oxo-dGTP pyrophosphatase MutT (NUDIX family)